MTFKNKRHSKETKLKISNTLKQKHEFAREGYNLFNKYFDDEFEETKPKYYDFLKLDNPLSQKFVQYNVSYQVTYRGEFDSLTFAPKTFEVFGLKGQEHEIENRTINMLINVETTNKKTLAPNTQLAIEKGSYVKVLPRGLEKLEPNKLSIEKQKEILSKKFVINKIDYNIEIENKKGNKGKIKLNTNFFI